MRTGTIIQHNFWLVKIEPITHTAPLHTCNPWTEESVTAPEWPGTLSSGGIDTANKWAALLLHVSIILPFVLLTVNCLKVSLLKKRVGAHDLRSHRAQENDKINGADYGREAGEGPRPGAALELRGGAFDAAPLDSSILSRLPQVCRPGVSWHPQLETAAQMSPALLHVCSALLTGNCGGRKRGI